MKKIIIIILLTIGIFSSCTDLSVGLWGKIDANNFPENEVQAERMLIPVIDPLYAFLDGGGWWFLQELTADNCVIPIRGEHWNDGGKWVALHRHKWNNDIEAINGLWYPLFKGIYESNKLIELMQESYNDGQELAINYTNYCIVMRAYYYWLAIDNFGDVPYVRTYSGTPEFPEKEERAVIWQGIVDDLEATIPNLPDGSNKYIVTKGMAYTLLAKLYLNAEVYTGTAHWAEADAYCDSVIALGAYSLENDPLAPFVTNNENSSENIFTIGYDEDGAKGFNLHMRTLHYAHKFTFNMTVQPWNGMAATEEFYNSFDDSDLRKRMFLVDTQYAANGDLLIDDEIDAPVVLTVNIPALDMSNTSTYGGNITRPAGVRFAKFEIKNGAKDNLSNDFPIFRYADVLLMKAETQIRINGAGAGDTWINMIRDRAGLASISGATLDDLLEERSKEMVWEGTRRQDLIRFGKFLNAWWEKDADDSQERLIFPIPKWAVDANPNLAD